MRELGHYTVVRIRNRPIQSTKSWLLAAPLPQRNAQYGGNDVVTTRQGFCPQSTALHRTRRPTKMRFARTLRNTTLGNYTECLTCTLRNKQPFQVPLSITKFL